MATQSSDDEFQHDLMEDFFLDFREAHAHCESALIELEHTPTDSTLLNDLFRSVHTIKGNLIYVGLRDLSPLLQSVEDVLDAIRNGSVTFDTYLSDVILVAMDTTDRLVRARLEQQPPPLSLPQLETLCGHISQTGTENEEQRQQAIRAALGIMAPDTLEHNVSKGKPLPSAAKTLVATADNLAILDQFAVELDDDLRFFHQLSAPLEERSQYWLGRTARILQLCLAMNRHAGEPVEPAQMAAAVFMHDVAMAFLPLPVLHKSTPLNTEETALLRSHTQQAFTLVSAMRTWEQASYIVLEHHEREDGTGYPAGLTGQHICPGAKILAIVDAFEARTHERAYSTNLKRPFVRAVLEINRCSGTHFDPNWVNVFNEVARTLQQDG
ncbi:MAG: HD domain-containing phosphohydrolase [Pseudomonadota bacterium]|nr:HD domain-containing phosphohydrolase [Pseudomonadota bacterium]